MCAVPSVLMCTRHCISYSVCCDAIHAGVPSRRPDVPAACVRFLIASAARREHRQTAAAAAAADVLMRRGHWHFLDIATSLGIRSLDVGKMTFDIPSVPLQL